MKVAVIGAGWAGLSAAVGLVSAGLSVSVWERAPVPGGRARRVTWQLDDRLLAIDNGQHILIGAYRATLELMRTVGVDEAAVFERRPLRLEYASGERIAAPDWPAPLHLAAALFGARGLRWADRLGMVMLIARLRFARWRIAPDRSVARWLQEQRQSEAACALLWSPLCLAALNTPIEAASAQVFATVLRDSVGATRADSDLLLPLTDLSDLLADRAHDWLLERGVRTRLAAPVRAITWCGGEGTPSAECWRVSAEADSDAVSAIVLATNWRDSAALLRSIEAPDNVPRDVPAGAYLERLDRLAPNRIATVWLLVDDHPGWRGRAMLALRCDSSGSQPGQWLFARAAVGAGQRLVAVVISASPADYDAGGLARAVIEQLNDQLGEHLPSNTPHKVIVEKAATFQCAPALARVPAQSPWPGIWLAGDFVGGEPRGDYPGTLEAAVRSGRRAAAAVLASCGQVTRSET